MRLRLLGLMAAPVLLTACLDNNEPTLNRLALINARSFKDGATEKLRLDAVFYEAFNINVQLGAAGSCQVLPFEPGGSSGSAITIDGGPFIEASVAGNTASIARTAQGTFIRYEMPTGAALDYTPGDTVTVTGVGVAEGFPAFEITGKTAEPFVLNPVGTAEAGQPLPISWSPAPTPGSFMTISLRYASSADLPAANAQVYCVLVDDGDGSIPATLAALWSNSSEVTRSVQAQRVRQAIVALSRSTRAQLFSFYTVPTPQLINP